MCEVVGVGRYWMLLDKIMGVVCEVVVGFLHGVVLLDVGNGVKLC